MIIEGTNISMINGDTETITVHLKDSDGVQIELVTGDTVYFTVKDIATDVPTILQKTVTSFTSGDAVITLDSADTISLDIKTYVYDIQVTYADATIGTLVMPSDFTLIKGVTE